jgi:nucleotide-binding universal stress UspA family protein
VIANQPGFALWQLPQHRFNEQEAGIDMDTLRSILLHFDAGKHSVARLKLARALAAQFEAKLDALFAVTPQFAPLPLPVGGHVPDAPLLDEVDPQHLKHAKAAFEQAAGEPGWPVEWHELQKGAAVRGFARQALNADLLVLGQRDPLDPGAFDVPADFVESVLMASGKPAVILPYRMLVPPKGFENVLVAWHPTREAAQALDGAIPVLRRAAQVHLVTFSDEAGTLKLQQQALSRLQAHGVERVQAHRRAPSNDVGADLWQLAGDLGCDLLVMGCYGHSRARELLLGGASSSVLNDMRLPVLMAH